MSGFKLTAQEYAVTHKIPLISFEELSIYDNIKNCLKKIDSHEDKLTSKNRNEILEFFRNECNEINKLNFFNEFSFLKEFIDEAENIFKNAFVRVLEDGTIIFLHNTYDEKLRINKLINKCTIHWSKDYKSWLIKNERDEDAKWKFIFELPAKIYDIWSKYNFSPDKALDIKEEYFKRICVYGNNNINNNLNFFILEISKKFIENARRERKDEKIKENKA